MDKTWRNSDLPFQSYENLAEAACQLDPDSIAVKAKVALKTRAV